MFVFDRVTGEPVWPIEQRAVPTSDVPGERTAATQPFPTKPAPFAKQGFTEDDVIDFTPEVKRLALEEVRKYRIGPLYTPPSLQGTVVMPGAIGGGGWGGGAFDPATGMLYIKATNNPALFRLFPVETPSDTVQARYMVELGRSLGIRAPATPGGERGPELPAHKPPYGTLTAIDLNRGEHLWQVPLGDEPSVRTSRVATRCDTAAVVRRSRCTGPDRDTERAAVRDGRWSGALRHRYARMDARSGSTTSGASRIRFR